MTARDKRIVKNVAKTGARTFGDIINLILKIIGTGLLIAITTGLVFACIFVIYIKTNLMTNLDLDINDFTLNLSSIIYYIDSGGQPQELVTVTGSENRIWVDYEDIPIHLEHALIAIEDQRFYSHHGVDWYRTAGAFLNMFVGMRDTFGGSSITQQLIKNLTQQDDVTVQRKLLEIFQALDFEKKYDKDAILTWYMNKVYFGFGRYGVSSAANFYFGKDVWELSIAECASLIGITNNPSMYSPYLDEEQNKGRQEDILFKMHEQHYIDDNEYAAALKETLVFKQSETAQDQTDNDGNEYYTWFEDAVINEVVSALMELKQCSQETAEDLLFSGGLQIYSTINLEIQAMVDSIYGNLDEIPEVGGSSQQIQSAIVITDPYTGNIVAMAGGVGEKVGDRLENRATSAERPPGSSIKPLSVYAPAMNLGLLTPNTRYDDSEDVKLKGHPDWMPDNYTGTYLGVITVREALRQSINTVAAQVMDQLTPNVAYEFMTEKLGFTTLIPDADNSYAPMSLGQLSWGATAQEMAAAYSIFVNEGIYTQAITFTHICDSEGKLIYTNTPDTHPAISPTVAYWMTDMLKAAGSWGSDWLSDLPNMPTAGKTGTTTQWQDRWFVGYTPYYVAAVWTGFDNPAKMSSYYNPAAQLWSKVMTLVHENLEYRDFNVPENVYLPHVPGVDEETPYKVRGIVEGSNPVQVLYEETDPEGKKLAGKEVTIRARQVEGYTIVGPTEKTIKIVKTPTNEKDNLVEFVYKKIADVDYTIRCVTEANLVIHTQTGKGQPGAVVTVQAPVRDGYTLVGNAEQTITLSENPLLNIVTFTYKRVEEQVNYTVMGIATDGTALYSQSYTGVVGSSVTITAQSIDGYTVIGVGSVTKTLSKNPLENIIEFVYVLAVPPPTDPPGP